ncbi:VacJ family lipoprotein [Ectothiorhodospiraceae bacterium BW-2]|nr:VacJ family lipoprotein [Ectothiorhodospiraceae bacterium BW-2]
MNRTLFAFNSVVDSHLMQPVARGYKAVTPGFVDTGITNFFNNLDEISVMANNLLQLKPTQALMSGGRFVANSTIGLLGLVDVATPMGLIAHDEDFGQTLAVWGVGSGPYLVLPFLGPSTLRDGSATVIEWAVEPRLEEELLEGSRYSLLALNIVDTRADLLPLTDSMQRTGGDGYTFMREAYLQRRSYQIYDGNPPPPEIDDALFGFEE